MKKPLTFFLALIIMLSVFTLGEFSVFSAEENFTLKPLSSSTAAVTGYTGQGGEVIIPSKIGDYTITEIGKEAFSKNKLITSVTIPDTVETVGDKAFAGAYVKSVTMSDSVKTLGESAFLQCVYLEDVVLSKSLTAIPDHCFSSCTRLESIHIPTGVTLIGDSAFQTCSHLKNVTLPSTLTGIGSYAFAYNFTLEEISLNEGLGEIKSYAFFQCSMLGSITLPSTLKRVGEYAFCENLALESITLNEGLEWLEVSAFDTCPAKEIKLPSTLKEIGDFAVGYYYDQEKFDYFKIQGFSLQCAENSLGLTYATDNGFDYTTYPATSPYKTGDVNMDETVNVKDATAIQKHMASLVPLSGEALALADFNCDSTVNVKDATAIQKAVAGIK